MENLLKRIQSIEELNFVLENWSQDDGKQPEEFSTQELVMLLEMRRDEFYESGHCLNEGLIGDLGPDEQKYCRQQLNRINRLWKKIKAN